MTDDLLLTGRVALIAGGAGSIGQAVAARLSVFGAIVVTADRPGSGADFEGDLTDPTFPDVLVEKIYLREGSLDILVNCQGITGASVPLWEQTDENWDAVLAICLTSGLLGGLLAGLIFPFASSILLPNAQTEVLMPDPGVSRLLWLALVSCLSVLTVTGMGKEARTKA